MQGLNLYLTVLSFQTRSRKYHQERAWHKNIHREKFHLAYLCRFYSYLFLFKLHCLDGYRRHKLIILSGHALDLVRFVSGR